MDKKSDEIWKHINGLHLGCEISSKGNVRINYGDHVDMLPLHVSSAGDIIVYISGKQMRVHRLVAEAFIPYDGSKMMVKHKDGDLQNNNVDNLAWVSYSESASNSVHSGKSHGRCVACKETGMVYGTLSTASACTGVPICAIEFGIANDQIMFGYTFSEVLGNVPEDRLVLSKSDIINFGVNYSSLDILHTLERM